MHTLVLVHDYFSMVTINYSQAQRVMLYVIVVTQARVCCLMYTHNARGPQHPRATADISGNARVP